tara:strand:- start:1048 stop:1509 length:462 start_codon:yes stop_codon:yes gene_type:complete
MADVGIPKPPDIFILNHLTTYTRNFVSKGWGYEDWIVNKEEYCGKVLFFKKGKRCSVHFHKLKDETFYLQDGQLELIVMAPNKWTHKDEPDYTIYEKWWNQSDKKKKVILKPGDSFHLPPYTIHTMRGLLDSHLFEFSTQHFDEDSYRIIKGD